VQRRRPRSGARGFSGIRGSLRRLANRTAPRGRGAGQKGEGRGRFGRRRGVVVVVIVVVVIIVIIVIVVIVVVVVVDVNTADQRRTTKSTRCRSRATPSLAFRTAASGDNRSRDDGREVSKHGDASPRKRRRGPYPSSSTSSSPLLLLLLLLPIPLLPSCSRCSGGSSVERINRREE